MNLVDKLIGLKDLKAYHIIDCGNNWIVDNITGDYCIGHVHLLEDVQKQGEAGEIWFGDEEYGDVCVEDVTLAGESETAGGACCFCKAEPTKKAIMVKFMHKDS